MTNPAQVLKQAYRRKSEISVHLDGKRVLTGFMVELNKVTDSTRYTIYTNARAIREKAHKVQFSLTEVKDIQFLS